MDSRATVIAAHERLQQGFALLNAQQPELGFAALVEAQDLLQAALLAAPEVSSAAEIEARYAETGVEVLPSGITVRWRPCDITAAMLANELPDRISEMVVYGPEYADPDEESDAADFTAWLQSLHWLVKQTIIEPVFVSSEPDPSNNEVAITRLRVADLLVIRRKTLWDRLPEVAALPFFRQEPDAGSAGQASPSRRSKQRRRA